LAELLPVPSENKAMFLGMLNPLHGAANGEHRGEPLP